jgi:peptide/nickel transport system permease protein
LFWYPGLFIVLIALAINFVGDGLRDAFDPRQRRLPRQGGAWQDFKKLVSERGKK